MKILFTFLFSLLVLEGIAQTDNWRFSFDSASIFGNSILVKLKDEIILDNPSAAFSSGQWHYQSVLTNLHPSMPGGNNLAGTQIHNCIIEKIFSNRPTDNYYILVKDTATKSIYYVNIEKAIMLDEVELPSALIMSKTMLFKAYLRSLKTVTENTAANYLNTTQTFYREYNEFERKKLVDKAKLICDSIRSSNIEQHDLKLFSVLAIGDYDFSKKGFAATNLLSQIQYDVALENGVNSLLLVFKNIPSDVFIGMNEKNAEDLVNNFAKLSNTERKLYCIYQYDLADNGFGYAKSKNIQLTGNNIGKAFIQNAIVKRIDCYFDPYFTNKIASILLTNNEITKSTSETQPPQDNGDTTIYAQVDQEPEFPGGKDAWIHYLNKYLRYPDEAANNEIQGNIIVQFVVDKGGNIHNIQAISGPATGGLREEATRIIERSGKWNTAIKDGKRVNAYKKQVIMFSLGH